MLTGIPIDCEYSCICW